MQIFNSPREYKRFLRSLIYYHIEGPKPKFSIFTPNTFELDSSKKIVEIVSYCLMPNHFHFLLKQVKDKGITEFMSKLCNSYAKYYNTKNERVGPLLQGDFKAVHIDDDEQLLHLTRYIHINPIVGFVTQDLREYEWSSYIEYVASVKDPICDKAIVLDQFKSAQRYEEFVLDHIDYDQKLELIKHLAVDFVDHSGWV